MSLSRRRIITEIVFFILLFLVSLEGIPEKVDHFIFTFLRFFILYVHASINRFLLFIPYFVKRRYKNYCLFSLILILGFTVLFYHFKIYYIQQYEPQWIGMFNYFDAFVMLLFGTILVNMLEFFYQFTQLQIEKSQVELASNLVTINQLKSQLNPHFLFNSLNNAYGLVLSRNEASADYIMSLSQLMRYQIEGSKKDLLSLEDDLEFMHHYITVEQQRIKKRCKIEWIDKISIVQKEKYEIAPLLFLPFVENAVKHGSASVDMSEIKIVFSMHNSMLQFFCNNTIPKHKASTSNTGTGLNNVRNRLQILYPKLHELSITNDDHFFNVNLSVALKLKDEV